MKKSETEINTAHIRLKISEKDMKKSEVELKTAHTHFDMASSSLSVSMQLLTTISDRAASGNEG